MAEIELEDHKVAESEREFWRSLSVVLDHLAKRVGGAAMSKLRAVLDRMNDIESTIARVEQDVGPKVDFATQLTLRSLEERRDMLREELAEITKQEQIEICDYRIIPESPLAYAVAAVSSALQDFQDLVSIVFDAQESKPKERAKRASRVTNEMVERAAAAIFCHAQFKGDDYTARQLARRCLEAALV